MPRKYSMCVVATISLTLDLCNGNKQRTLYFYWELNSSARLDPAARAARCSGWRIADDRALRQSGSCYRLSCEEIYVETVMARAGM
jgi:hypothetical protein